VLGLPTTTVPTRRWYYFIPAAGEPRGVVHRIERHILGGLPGDRIAYSSWGEQVEALRRIAGGGGRVAMQYSPCAPSPTCPTWMAAPSSWLRSLGVEVASSAELIQHFEARWTPAALETHLEAGRRADRVRAAASSSFASAPETASRSRKSRSRTSCSRVRQGRHVHRRRTHRGVQCQLLKSHYEPTAQVTSPIRSGDWVLLDMWCKLDQPGAVYYDITWTAWCGDQPPDRIARCSGSSPRRATRPSSA